MSGEHLLQEEGTCKDMDIALRKKKTETAERMTKATENKEENKVCKLICGNVQAKWQLKIGVGNKADNEKIHELETVQDSVLSNEVNDKGSLGRNKSNRSKVTQQGVEDQPRNSANTVAVTATSKMNVQDDAQPLKLSSNSARLEESTNTSQIDTGMNRNITEGSTDFLKTDECSCVMSQEGSKPPLLTCQDVDEGDDTETGQKSQTSGTENKKKDLTDMSGSNVTNTSQKVKSLGKRVRFNLKGNETSSTLPPNSTEEISKEETKIMFSDEEDKEDKDKSIDEEVSQRISRIQNLLRSDRLRTNRKRKYPVV